MDGTGPTPVPDKARGHLSSALNVSCPVIRAISSQYCTPFHLLYATVAAPFDYKRRPMAYWKRIKLFGTTHPTIASLRAQELSEIHPPKQD